MLLDFCTLRCYRMKIYMVYLLLCMLKVWYQCLNILNFLVVYWHKTLSTYTLPSLIYNWCAKIILLQTFKKQYYFNIINNNPKYSFFIFRLELWTNFMQFYVNHNPKNLQLWKRNDRRDEFNLPRYKYKYYESKYVWITFFNVNNCYSYNE